jgi:hypothetical protein
LDASPDGSPPRGPAAALVMIWPYQLRYRLLNHLTDLGYD